MIAHLGFEMNNEMIYLIETLKVESYWSLKNFTLTLQNKDIRLLNNIEKIVNSLGIKVGKRVLLKVRLENNTQKEEIKLIWKNRELNFHIEKSPFDKNKVKAVTSLPYKKSYRLVLMYKNKKIPININCLKEKIKYESSLNCWIYKDLRFPTKKLLEFLHKYCGGNKNIRVENLLLNSKDTLLIMSAFSALVDCEGTINWYDLKREIQIRMKEKVYLLQWKKLLEKFNIGCRLEKNKDLWGIVISGWEDFDRLEKMGFKLYHSKKAEKWKRMMNGFKRNQISRDSYKDFYVKKLKELNKKVTSKEFANYLNKSKRVVNHYLLKLEKEKLLQCDRKNWPYLYFISTSSVR